MNYKIRYYNLGDMPREKAKEAVSFDLAIDIMISILSSMAPPYDDYDAINNDPWDKIMGEMTGEKSTQKNKDFIRYCLPNGYVIEAYANG